MGAADRSLSSLFLVPLTLVLIGILLFLALLYGQWDLTVLSLILFGVAVGTKLWSRWSVDGIGCSFGIDRRRLFPDETLRLKVTVENRKFLPVLLRAGAPIRGLAHGPSSEAGVEAETGLLWYQKAGFHWELRALRRGVHRIGPLGITTGDLFGFFPKHKEMAEAIEVVVYPRLVPLKPPKAPRRDFFGIPGAKSPVQDPVYILGTRDYQNGRPAKHIHWKATARHHKLQEKIFEPSAQEKVLLAVDAGPYRTAGAGESFERLLETAASTAVRLAGRGCAVGLVTNGRMTGEGPAVVPVARNPRQLSSLLEALARVRMEPVRNLVETFRLHLRLPHGISCLYFSLENNEAARAARGYFTRRQVPFLWMPCHRDSAPASAGTGGEGSDQTQARVKLASGEGQG